MSLDLGSISGAIWGGPDRTLQSDRVERAPTIGIDFTGLAAAASRQASTMVPNSHNQGLTIDPPDTRFVRISTGIAYVAGPRAGEVAVGFLDTQSKAGLTLVYFDRPCRLLGTQEFPRADGGKRIMTFDVTIDKPGLSWLERTREGPDGRSTMSQAAESPHPMAVIGPSANIKFGSFHIQE
jgi:hypothetical protein